MLIRPVELPRDMPELERLFGLITECDGHAPIGEHKYLDLLNADPTRASGLVAEIEGDEAIAGYIAVSPTRQDGAWALELAAHPMHRDAGSLTAMIRAGLDHIEAHGGSQVRVWTFMPNLATVLESCGFEPERELRQLRRSLPADESPRFPQPVRIEPFRPGADEERWLRVNNAAFVDHPENGGWTRAVLEDREQQAWFDPAGFRMAWEDDTLVGFCWTKIHHGSLGEIYVIAVAPEAQGRGLGRALVLEGLRYLAEAGLDKVMLYVDAGNDAGMELYQRLGFRLDHVDRSFVSTRLSA